MGQPLTWAICIGNKQNLLKKGGLLLHFLSTTLLQTRARKQLSLQPKIPGQSSWSSGQAVAWEDGDLVQNILSSNVYYLVTDLNSKLHGNFIESSQPTAHVQILVIRVLQGQSTHVLKILQPRNGVLYHGGPVGPCNPN